MKNKLRMAVYIDSPFWFDGENYTSRCIFDSYIVKISSKIETLVLFAPLKITASEKGDHSIIIPDNVKIIPCPFLFSQSDLYKRLFKIAPKTLKIIRGHQKEWDIIGVFDSNLLTLLIQMWCSISNNKSFFFIRSDPIKNRPHEKPGFWGNVIGLVFGFHEDLINRLLARNSLTFAIGEGLYNKYKNHTQNINLFYSNMIPDKMIENYKITEKVSKKNINLLFVGRIIPQKGINYLIDAVDILKKKGIDVRCFIVGSGRYEHSINKYILEKNLSNQIVMKGHVEWNENLFNIYRESDFFIIPSLTEGFPKTIFEAMAFRTLVIASNAGGISGIITNRMNGVLVEPRSGRAISEAIMLFSLSNDLYNKIVNNAYEMSKQFTIEKQHLKLIEIVNHYIMQD